MSTLAPLVERHTLPPVPPAAGPEFMTNDTYATVIAGKVTAEVLRLCFWDPRDGDTQVLVEHEVRIDGLEETCGFCGVIADKPAQLLELAAVCEAAASLLAEVTR